MLGGATGLHPFVHFILLELPEEAHAIRGHPMLVAPAVNHAAADTEVLAKGGLCPLPG